MMMATAASPEAPVRELSMFMFYSLTETLGDHMGAHFGTLQVRVLSYTRGRRRVCVCVCVFVCVCVCRGSAVRMRACQEVYSRALNDPESAAVRCAALIATSAICGMYAQVRRARARGAMYQCFHSSVSEGRNCCVWAADPADVYGHGGGTARQRRVDRVPRI